MSNRIAAAEKTQPWPSREDHVAEFRNMLGEAHAAAVREEKALAFLYIGQTSPETTRGLVTSVAMPDASEVLAAVANLVRTQMTAGAVTPTQVVMLAQELVEIAKS